MFTELNLGIFSYSLAAFLFFIFSLLLIGRWRSRLGGILFLLYIASVIIWALGAAYSSQFDDPVTISTVTLELLRNLFWSIFLIQFLSNLQGNTNTAALNKLAIRLAWGVPLLMLVVTIYIGLVKQSVPIIGFDLWVIGHVLTAIVGLSLVEQVFRSANYELRWAIKFLCFGLGAMYAFDFYLYSDALLFKRMDLELWQARGFVYAIVLPLILVAVSRNTAISTQLSVSRSAVFYTTAIVFTGLYLLIMSAGGFYLQAFGGEWGQIIAIAFVFSGILFLLILFFSGHIRAKFKVVIDKHFLDYKYDYRDEWLGLIRELSSASESTKLEDKALHAILEMMDSPGGSLWTIKSRQTFVSVAGIDSDDIFKETINLDDSLACFLETWQWVINIDEYTNERDLYQELKLPDWLANNPKIWLIVPLMLQSKLYGFIFVYHPRAPREFNWEDIDLLKTAGRQVAIHLAQNRSALALIEARQFQAFNRFSAFVVHDLKNLVSQLALVVKNAEKHKHNPAFMDDAISTVDNAVERMNRMLAQLRSGKVVSEIANKINLSVILHTVLKEKSNSMPRPTLVTALSELFVRGNEERLISVIGHLVQNAQDATAEDGFVTLDLYQSENKAVISIKDNGSGMKQTFIDDRLFTPFDTTKGLTGMGIGAHESRSFVEELGGSIDVKSVPGKGTQFTVFLPLYKDISREG